MQKSTAPNMALRMAAAWLIPALYPLALPLLDTAGGLIMSNPAIGIPTAIVVILLCSSGPLVTLWLLRSASNGKRSTPFTMSAVLATLTPPLFTLVGLATFMGGFPMYRNTIWYSFVAICLAASWLPLPSLGFVSPALRKAHRWGAIPLAVFIAAHVVNAASGILSLEAQNDLLSVLRSAYQFLPFEALLVASLVTIILTGASLSFKQLSAARGKALIKILSGLYLGAFMVPHAIATIILGRSMLGVDTSFIWAGGGEAGILFNPYSTYLIPYYLLAVVATFVHLAYAILPRLTRTMSVESRAVAAARITQIGFIVAALCILSLCGVHLLG